jgi:hypothetical protein
VSALPVTALCARTTGEATANTEKQEISEIIQRPRPHERISSSSKNA